MSTTSADLSRVAFGRLVAGALPSSPTMMVARVASEGVAYTPNYIDSPEIDASGQTRDAILVGAQVSGPVEFPLARSNWFHDMLAAVFRNEWSGNVLVPGSSVLMFDMQKKFVTPTGNVFHRYSDVAAQSLSIRVSPNDVIMGTLQMIGKDLTIGTTDISGATYPDPGTYPPFTAPEVTEVNFASLTAAHCFSNLTMTFNSNLRPVECIGTLGTKERNLGRFQVTIEGTAYFVSNDILDEFLAQTNFETNITLSDGAGNSYAFNFPRCKITSAPVNIPGTNNDVVVPISITAQYDPTDTYSVQVTRTLAA